MRNYIDEEVIKLFNNIKINGYCIYRKIKEKRKKTHISIKARVGKNVLLEGGNLISAYCKIDNSFIGYASYIASNSKFDYVYIGRYSSIGPNVEVISGRHPSKKFVSTHPVFFSKNPVVRYSYVNGQKFEEFMYADEEKKYKVIIGNDVWIGAKTSILEGVTIGDGAIIAAGALVNKDVPPYSIVGGVPAKVIRYRFTDEQIEMLLKLKWWDKEKKWIVDNAELFEDIEVFLNKIYNIK